MTGRLTSSPKSKLEAVLLDVGNVVLELNFDRFLNAFGLPDKSMLIHNPFDDWETYDAFERGLLSEEDFLIHFNEHLKTEFNLSDFNSRWNKIFVGETKDIRSLLTNLKVPVYALTNSNPTHINHALKSFPVMKDFKKIFTSYELGARKPEQRIYQAVLEELQYEPSGVLFIDDKNENVLAATSLGMQGAQLRNDTVKMKQIFEEYQIL